MISEFLNILYQFITYIILKMYILCLMTSLIFKTMVSLLANRYIISAFSQSWCLTYLMFLVFSSDVNFMWLAWQVNHALLEEIREINHGLIDTVVDISDEDVDPTSAAVTAAEGAEGTVVKCSFIPVALSPTLKSQYASLQVGSQIPQLQQLNFLFYYIIYLFVLLALFVFYHHTVSYSAPAFAGSSKLS